MQNRQNILAIAGVSVLAIAAVAWAVKSPSGLMNKTELKSSVQSADKMADTVAIDKAVAPFSLPDADGKNTAIQWDKSKATVLIFVSTRCPVSNAYNERMAQLAKDYSAKGVTMYGINANQAEDAAAIKAHAQQHNFSFAVLKDKGNIVADQFAAQVTPEAYVIDKTGTLRYHGRIDDSQDASDIQSHDLQVALDAVLADKIVPAKETRAFGCGIKRAR